MELFYPEDQFELDIYLLLKGEQEPPIDNLPHTQPQLPLPHHIGAPQNTIKGLNKCKPICKQTKKSKGQVPSDSQRDRLAKVMGRPNNDTVEKEHLRESRMMNDVIYHYVHLLALLRFKQGDQQPLHSLNITESEEEQMNRTEKVMNQQNFPDINSPQPVFLIHPNSLHSVFQHYQRQHRKSYSPRELQGMFLGFLRKRQLLTVSIFNYLLDYWEDIICVATNSKEEGEEESLEGEQCQKEKKKLKEDLDTDESITAYQIACYLHACSKSYRFEITPSP